MKETAVILKVTYYTYSTNKEDVVEKMSGRKRLGEGAWQTDPELLLRDTSASGTLFITIQDYLTLLNSIQHYLTFYKVSQPSNELNYSKFLKIVEKEYYKYYKFYRNSAEV